MDTLRKIISGGQTGVDRAALDVALEAGIPCGGWCPRGRRAEDGPLDSRYPLRETPSPFYAQRTEWNVRDSDGTLILAAGPLTGGTALTRRLAERYGKPVLVVELQRSPSVARVTLWLRTAGIGVLNVAGPRESQQPGLSETARGFLREVVESMLSR